MSENGKILADKILSNVGKRYSGKGNGDKADSDRFAGR